MSCILDDPGVLQVVLEEYEKRKLPRLFAIKSAVDKGARLGNEDLGFLRLLYREVAEYESFVDSNIEFKGLYINLVNLYGSIMHTALDNEQRNLQ